jgi:hypothetical protein
MLKNSIQNCIHTPPLRELRGNRLGPPVQA